LKSITKNSKEAKRPEEIVKSGENKRIVAQPNEDFERFLNCIPLFPNHNIQNARCLILTSL
jgi:hypothetical protein